MYSNISITRRLDGKITSSSQVLSSQDIGTKFADIVVACLEGLQDEEKGGLLNDEYGMVIETAYVAQIGTLLSKMEETSL